MNNKINKLIPKALDAITKSGMVSSGEFDKEYKGYIASMGASIIQSGLIATLAFYSNPSPEAGERRIKLLHAIFMMIEDNRQGKLFDYVLEKTKPANHNNFTADQLDKTELKKLENNISDALIALKLALRTFKEK